MGYGHELYCMTQLPVTLRHYYYLLEVQIISL